jgi:hypothetical protein
MLNFAKDLAAALDALRRHAILFLLAIALIALALLARSWLDARDATARLAATLAAQQKTITDADQRQSTRDAQLTQTLAQITAAKQKVQTPTQAAAALSQAIPQFVTDAGLKLPSPITIELPTASDTDSVAGVLAPGAVSRAMPGADSKSESGDTGLTATSTENKSSAMLKSASRSPWSALKSGLAKFGIGHASKSATNYSGKNSENLKGSVASQQGSAASRSSASAAPLLSSAQSSASQQNCAQPQKISSAQSVTPGQSSVINMDGCSPSQSASAAQGNSPPTPATIPPAGATATQTNSAPRPGANPKIGAAAEGNSASPSASASSATTTQTGPPPAVIRVPQEDLKPLYDAVEDCQACHAKLAAAQGDLTDERAKFAAATAQRDAAISAARGTFWKRTRTAAKWIVIGAAAGAVLAKYH